MGLIFSHHKDLTFFTNLPKDIIIKILCRLPVKSILCCKLVCKLLLNLIKSPEFAQAHLSSSVFDGLIILWSFNSYRDNNTPVFKLCELSDELELDLHYIHPVMTWAVNNPPADVPLKMHGSVNGLLLLSMGMRGAVYICNPITREYIELYHYSSVQVDIIGFGVSKTNGQYKVVRFIQPFYAQSREIFVYTIGTGLWRAIYHRGSSNWYFSNSTTATFFNGNLHWLVQDGKDNGPLLISRFDLETELFDTFSAPFADKPQFQGVNLVVLKDHLCVCDNRNLDKFVIWAHTGMEYGWTQLFIIDKNAHAGILEYGNHTFWDLCPMKLFKNGDILMAYQFMNSSNKFYSYSQNLDSIEEIDIFAANDQYDITDVKLHSSSFISLRCFDMVEFAMWELVINF